MIGTPAARAWSMASSGLRHDAVVGRHHQHHDVGDLGAAGAHAGEGFVAGRIDEDDLAAVHLHVIRADVLGDAAGLARRHVGFADGVEQRGLAVIHVAHDGDHGRALLQVLGLFGLFHRLHGLFFVADGGGGGAEVARHFGGQLGIERLVDGGEDAAVHQLLDHQGGLDVELFGELLDGDALGDGDFAVDGRRPGLHLAARAGRRIFSSSMRSRGWRAPGVYRRGGRAAGSTGGGAMPGSMRPRDVGCCGRGPGPAAAGGAPGRTPGLATRGWPGRIGPR